MADTEVSTRRGKIFFLRGHFIDVITAVESEGVTDEYSLEGDEIKWIRFSRYGISFILKNHDHPLSLSYSSFTNGMRIYNPGE